MNKNNVKETKKNTGISDYDNMNAIANDTESKVTGQLNSGFTDFTDFTDKKNTDSLTNTEVANVAIMTEDPESNTAEE